MGKPECHVKENLDFIFYFQNIFIHLKYFPWGTKKSSEQESKMLCLEGIPERGKGTVNGRWVPEKATKQAQNPSPGLFQEPVRSEIQQTASNSDSSFFISWLCDISHMSLSAPMSLVQ